MDGLRTLVLCTRDLTEQEFNAWKAAHHNAAIAIGKYNFQFREKIRKFPVGFFAGSLIRLNIS